MNVKDKVQWNALHVVHAWLRRENHYQGNFSNEEAIWVKQIQEELAKHVCKMITQLEKEDES